MMIVFDDDDVAHEVYNKTEICEAQARHRDHVENWQVRTMCCRDEECDFLQAGISLARIRETAETGDHVTCVRCACVECDHGIGFDKDTADRFRMSSNEVRSRWPRLEGTCRKGCGYHGIAYASHAHYIYGDW
jgi:hypothetical protein